MAEKGRDRINPIKGGDEEDVFCKWGRYYHNPSSKVIAAIKRQFNKRTRKRAKQIVTEEAMNE